MPNGVSFSGLFPNTLGARMANRKPDVKYTRLEYGREYAFNSLKGKALAAASDAGMIPADSSGTGCNIAPFLKFWDLFAPALNDAFEDFQQQRQTLEQ